MITEREIEAVLQTYSLEEILEINNLTHEEVLNFLVSHKVVDLPEPKPVDVE